MTVARKDLIKYLLQIKADYLITETTLVLLYKGKEYILYEIDSMSIFTRIDDIIYS